MISLQEHPVHCSLALWWARYVSLSQQPCKWRAAQWGSPSEESSFCSLLWLRVLLGLIQASDSCVSLWQQPSGNNYDETVPLIQCKCSKPYCISMVCSISPGATKMAVLLWHKCNYKRMSTLFSQTCRHLDILPNGRNCVLVSLLMDWCSCLLACKAELCHGLMRQKTTWNQ